MKDIYRENQYRRWYDKDPILSKSMRTLEESDDETQIKVALNIIKIIVEHNIAYDEYSEVDDIITAVEDGMNPNYNNRWYDIEKTVKVAISMLENSPFETQKVIAKQMAQMVVNKIKEDKDEEVVNQELDSEE